MNVTQWAFLAAIKIHYIQWRNARVLANMAEVERLSDEALEAAMQGDVWNKE